MHDVFISYARKDKARVQPLLAALQQQGLSVFFDIAGIDGGEQYPDVIDQAVRNSACVVALWSPYALTREWVKNECRVGMRRGRLVTAMIEPVSEDDIPTEFGAPHLIDLTTFDGQAQHNGLQELLRAMSQKISRAVSTDGVAAATAPAALQHRLPPPIPARTPDAAGARETWEALKESENIERLKRFLDEHAAGTPTAFAVEERLDKLGLAAEALAGALYFGNNGHTKNLVAAREQARLGALAGRGWCAYLYGKMLVSGEGGARDVAAARPWLEQAAQHKLPYAMRELALAMYDADERANPRIVELLGDALALDDEQALIELGSCLWRLEEPVKAAGLALLRREARNTDRATEVRVKAISTYTTYEDDRELRLVAAGLGDAYSMEQLSHSYERDEPKDKRAAAEWRLKAIRAGSKRALKAYIDRHCRRSIPDDAMVRNVLLAGAATSAERAAVLWGMYSKGLGGPRDDRAAEGVLSAHVQAGGASHRLAGAIVQYTGDLASAIPWFERALAEKESEAAFIYASVLKDLGGEANTRRARELFKQHAAADDLCAADFALMSLLGQGGPVDEKEARRILEQADRRVTDGELARYVRTPPVRYVAGKDRVDGERARRAQMHRKDSEPGADLALRFIRNWLASTTDSAALNALGMMAVLGLGGPQDFADARARLEASQYGDSAWLVQMLERGVGGPADLERARRLAAGFNSLLYAARAEEFGHPDNPWREPERARDLLVKGAEMTGLPNAPLYLATIAHLIADLEDGWYGPRDSVAAQRWRARLAELEA